MFEQQKKRLRFHCKHVLTQMRYKLNIYTEKEKNFLAVVDPEEDVVCQTDEEKEEMRAFLKALDSVLDKTIDFDPHRTVLFCGRHGYRCNFLTIQKYQEDILIKSLILLGLGIDTFIVDYISPFGLAALEKLLEMRKKGYAFKLYAVQGGSITDRKTYRLIPEIGSEILLLTAKCDKHFSPSPGGNAIRKVYRDVIRIFDEEGIHINPLAIIEDLEESDLGEADLTDTVISDEECEQENASECTQRI